MSGPADIPAEKLKAARDAVTNAHAALSRLDGPALDLLFRHARTHNTWQEKPVTDDDLKAIYEVYKWGPTSANGNHARVLFARSVEAKEKLAGCVAEGNVPKVRAAPVVAILGYETKFWERLPELFSHRDMTGPFRNNPTHTETTAFRNSSLQGAYLMLAARALGFDIGAMSGFNNEAVDEAFFAGTSVKSNFLCNIGYGDVSGLFPRLPRLAFEDACKII
ncbi:MAG: malonic semialdehyde reductase [Hyphomicrobiales bacterium]